MLSKICVLVDNSPFSDACSAAALSLAQAYGAEVTGVHVYTAGMHDRRFRQMEAGLPEEYIDDHQLERQRTIHTSLISLGLDLISHSYLDALEKRCREVEAPFTRTALEGKNWEKLAQHITGSDYELVIMGARGHGSSRPDTVGSVCLRVLRRIRTDALVVRELAGVGSSRDGAESPVMVALDGSPEAFGGLQTALALGKAFGRPVEAVATYDPYFHYAVFYRMVNVLSDEAARVFRFKEMERLHEEIIDTGLARLYQTHLEVARRLAQAQGMALQTTLLTGRAADELLEYAGKRRPWLLVVGRVGVHNSDGMEMGSVTEHLLRTAPCNVWVGARRFTPPLEEWAESSLRWTDEAQAALERVPAQYRGPLRLLGHRLALERGHSVVTASLVEAGMESLIPKKAFPAAIKDAALSVALQALRSEAATLYLCPACGHATREVRPSSCPVCKTPGDGFMAVDTAELEAMAERQGGVQVERSFDGRAVRWARAAIDALNAVQDPYQRRLARLRIEKEARLKKLSTITLDFSLGHLGEAGRAEPASPGTPGTTPESGGAP